MPARPHDRLTVPTARGRATRDRIVAAAAELMHQRGVAATSLDDVLAATATSKSQLYHYFADKASLVRAVVAYQTVQVLAAQEPEIDQLRSLAALRAWADRVVELNGRTRSSGGCPLGRLASELSDADPQARAAIAAGFRAWQDRLANGLAAMRDQGALPADCDPDTLAAGLLAALQGGLLLAQAARSPDPLSAALDQALDGIGAIAARKGAVVPSAS